MAISTILTGVARRSALLLILLVAGVVAPDAHAQTIFPDDPVLEDPDRLDMPAPEAREQSDLWDFVQNVTGDPASYDGPALNVNTLGEVPRSSWYTPRHYHEPMALEELRRGPNEYETGPAEGPLRVVSTKDEGKSVGMQVIDERGDRYLLKFDPAGHLEMSSGAEAVVTRFVHALGYHVPQNYVTRFDPDRLVADTSEGISKAQVRRIVGKVPRYPDGTVRALASLFLEGEKPLGPFLYFGTRPDDGNDIFPHEGRRELRAFRLVSAWLNHDDARSINSLDMLVEEEGRTFVRHHLIDFGSTLGAGALEPKSRWAGYEYALDWDQMFLRAISLGFAADYWVDIDYPALPAVGRFEAAHFDPTTWRPQYPNPAFERMDGADAFWMARQIANFSDEAIEAVVEAGAYSNPEAAAYIVRTLQERRDRIAEAYLRYGGGLDRFEAREGELRFEDLAASAGVRAEAPRRTAEWFRFENGSGPVGEACSAAADVTTKVALPPCEAPFVQAVIRTEEEGVTRVTLRREPDGYEVVALDRTSSSSW